MLNKYLLADKYKILIGQQDKEEFTREVEVIRSSIDFSKLKTGPLLIFGNDIKNALYYTLGIFYSVKDDKILDFIETKGQTITTQHFMEMEKDFGFANDLYYTDLAFIELSSVDNLSEYLEKLVIEITDFRRIRGKTTVIFVNTYNMNVSIPNLIPNIRAYFHSNRLQVLDITAQTSGYTNRFSTNGSNANSKPTRPRRKLI